MNTNPMSRTLYGPVIGLTIIILNYYCSKFVRKISGSQLADQLIPRELPSKMTILLVNITYLKNSRLAGDIC